MPRLDDARLQILDTAQLLAQNRGVGGFSFRDVANEVGIKSASIHYHFPTKDDLIIELARRYREMFFQQLEELTRDIAGPEDRIKALIGIFQTVLIEENRMCLCGMLAADAELLSDEARSEVARFYDECIDWLSREWANVGHENPRHMAIDTFVRLEGGMLISRISASTEPFEVIKKQIENTLFSTGN